MIFPKEFISQVKERILTSQVVAKRVALKNKGKEFSGLCPFHSEKTPSFTVNDEKGFYHCFGCGAHGNIFDFVMLTEGLSFPDAVEKLALEAGMTLPKKDEKTLKQYDEHARLMQCAESAAKYFQDSLRTTSGVEAREYLKNRGISGQVIEEFRLGLAPEAPGKLQQALESQGFSVKEMTEIGLIKNGYEMFRGRIIFPITDTKARVIAFGGRILGAGEPKYLNSPETPIFHKRRVLFGKAIARKPAYDLANIIVAEGYMDIIALNQAGFKNAVAPLGTSLTDEHLQELWALAKEPTMCFDGDNAGKRAMLRAAELALQYLKPGFSLKFIALPAGQDPDDIVRADKTLFASLLEAARPLSEIIYEAEKDKSPVKTPEQQADLRARLEKLAAKIPDKSVERNYQDYFRQRQWQDFRHINSSAQARPALNLVPTMAISAVGERVLKLECAIVGIICANPELLDDTSIEEEFVKLEFSQSEIDKLRQNILANGANYVDTGAGPQKQFAELLNAGDINEKLAAYINLGAGYAKSSTPKQAWENILAQYHLEQTKDDKGKISDINDFEKLQAAHNQLEQSTKRINATSGE